MDLIVSLDNCIVKKQGKEALIIPKLNAINVVLQKTTSTETARGHGLNLSKFSEILKAPKVDNNKTNTIYYPYIIYKILEAILSSGNRKYLILECIHLQSRETLIVNDKIWEKICKYIDITYIPTDKYLFNFD